MTSRYICKNASYNVPSTFFELLIWAVGWMQAYTLSLDYVYNKSKVLQVRM